MRAVPPHFPPFNYGEKVEYWSLAWGTIVMASTGLLVWFKVAAVHFVARWWIDVALAIHFYEAVLATLAILVWHMYQVIFDPDVYPMNWAWWDGKMAPHEPPGENDEAPALAPEPEPAPPESAKPNQKKRRPFPG